MRNTYSFFVFVLLTGFIFLGCGEKGPSLYPAHGTVTYMDRPLAGARVTFIPEGKGAIAMGTTNEEGYFEIKTGTASGVVLGPSAVTVSLLESAGGKGLSPTMTPEEMQSMAMSGELQKAMDKENTSLIPERYSNAKSSGLKVDVTRDSSEYNLDLK